MLTLLQIWAYIWLAVICIGYLLSIIQCIQESKTIIPERKPSPEEPEIDYAEQNTRIENLYIKHKEKTIEQIAQDAKVW